MAVAVSRYGGTVIKAEYGIVVLSCNGTNDLTQYTLACDRQNPSLERFADPHSPAVLRMIQMTIEAAHRHGIWCGICGELGADLSLTDTFLRLGIDELSVSPTSVLPLRNVIRNH